MARRISISQLKSNLQQQQSMQRQAISRYNQAVRKYNQEVRDLKRAINRSNQEVRAYNSRRRQDQQRLQSELRRLQSQHAASSSVLRISVTRLHTTYTRLEQSAAARSLSPADNYFLDLAEREAANSVEVVNALLAPEVSEEIVPLQQTAITDEIAVISEDLDTRWRGALFSLNPANPDAARHFCTSSREIFAQILDIKAPDEAVFVALPNARRTERGNATRRSKIAFLVLQKGIQLEELAEFASEDIDNILELFDVLNAGTHAQAGRYDMRALAAIKQRVEDTLLFLSRLAA
jgi:hypothetical protein